MSKEVSAECKETIKQAVENVVCLARGGGQYPTEYEEKMIALIYESVKKEINK